MKRKINLLIAVMLVALVFVAAGCAQQTPQADGNTITCSVMVDCITAMESDPDAVADIADENGKILPSTDFQVAEGSSAYDVMAASGLELGETNGYVSSINGLGEGDFGSMSGWLYNINGEFPAESLRDTIVSDGDSIAWQYTCDGGADLGMEF